MSMNDLDSSAAPPISPPSISGWPNNSFAFDAFTIYGGGRYHFNDHIALTLRLGAPLIHDNVISIGVSFLL